MDEFRVRTESSLQAAIDHHVDGTANHAKHMRDKVVTAMAALRETGDQIEVLVPHGIWPLPTYREMLFIK